ncbi:hypothetical protein SDC9_205097 [bioreactor metagenome]|uniref:Uncharacterized protein n=1 Tax=bioreactor metagenome TaxID=1076179 RepID=A0A645JCX6_9ZZZZ
MIEFVIIAEAIISCIVRHIYINTFYFSLEPLQKRRNCKQIISLDYQVISVRKFCSRLLTVFRIADNIAEGLRK